MKPLRLPTIQALRTALTAVTERTGASAAEVYVKAGGGVQVEIDPWRAGIASPSAPADWRSHTLQVEEKGWALRAGADGRALFVAESGSLPAPGGWRLLNRHSLRPGSLMLPSPNRRKATMATGRKDPPDHDAEALGRDLVHRILERTRSELPGSRLIRARLHDGASASVLANSEGVTGRSSLRLATVEMEFAVERKGTRGSCSLYRAAGDLMHFDASTIAAEVADRLTLATAAPEPVLPSGELAVSPAVASNLLALLSPVLRDRDGWETLQRLSSGSSLGPTDLAVLDDGALETGWIRTSVDDEGVPTRAVTLIRDGEPGEPLLTWEDDGWSGFSATGCRRRSGWRAPPELSHSHLYIARGPEPADRIRTGIRRGCYLLDRAPGGRLGVTFEDSDSEAEASFEIDVTGFVIEHDRILGAIPRARLGGSVRQLLRGIRAIGDDLRFLPVPGPVGAPTLLLTGLQLEPV
ncbi:MAG: metallopeptidase TldD-related protein [Acidobacteria bacterium]|nr:metallopeptidase TldD-related protein [Acidobacteriota bacterium]MCY3965539.1 metallopeptidase TldD-related protein [Acidobacteriota bacterium]